MTILRLLPALLLVACATRSAIDESRQYARRGDYNRAYAILEEARSAQLADGGEVDPALEAEHREAHIAFLAYRAESRIFQEMEAWALADLAELEALAPDHPAIPGLRDRAMRKRAKRLRETGNTELQRKEYVAAIAAFLESDALEPGNADTKEGIKAVQEATSRLSKRGQEEFLEAVRKLPEFRFVEVQWHAGNAMHNLPQHEDAKPLQDRARRENAQKSMARAKEYESAGQYGAALVEYRAAQRIDPALPGIAAAIAQMVKEQQAAVLIDEAQMHMHAGRFDEARQLLGDAFALSVMARNEIGSLTRQAKQLEGEKRYAAARDLEVLGKKSEALAAFEALAKDWPDGVSDEEARIASLRTDVEGAAKAWEAAEAAEAAGDLPKALELYLDSERFYAGWKDGKERIARLRAAIQAAGGGNGSGGNANGSGNGGSGS